MNYMSASNRRQTTEKKKTNFLVKKIETRKRLGSGGQPYTQFHFARRSRGYEREH